MFACLYVHDIAREPRCLPDDRVLRPRRSGPPEGGPHGDRGASAANSGAAIVQPSIAEAGVAIARPSVVGVGFSRPEEADEQGTITTRLLDVARGCSPRIERRGERLVVVDASGLTRLFGGPCAFARQVEGDGRRAGLVLGVAVAPTRTAAMALAATREGVSVVLPGREAAALAPIPLAVLAVVDEGYTDEKPSVPRRQVSSSRHYRMAPLPGHDDLPAHTPPAARARAAAAAPCPDALATLERWGIHTLGALAALPRAALSERLGDTGTRWQRLARGEDLWPLVREVDEERFEQAMALEWPIEGLEPLSFVLARLFDALGDHLARKDRGAVVVHVWLKLVTREVHHRALELAAPMRDPKVLRTLVLLDLESHPPAAGIDEVRIAVEPAPGRIVQYSLIEKPLPSPDTLATLTARLSALMGQGRCGSPSFEDTHRPGLTALAPFAPGRVQSAGKGQSARRARSAEIVHGAERKVQEAAGGVQAAGCGQIPQDGTVRTVPLAPDSPWPGPRAVLRRYRRPIVARVVVAAGRPARVTTNAPGLGGGRIIQASGPWLVSGDWWSPQPWDDEEWDVALAEGGCYRLSRDRPTGRWTVTGQWD